MSISLWCAKGKGASRYFGGRRETPEIAALPLFGREVETQEVATQSGDQLNQSSQVLENWRAMIHSELLGTATGVRCIPSSLHANGSFKLRPLIMQSEPA